MNPKILRSSPDLLTAARTRSVIITKADLPDFEDIFLSFYYDAISKISKEQSSVQRKEEQKNAQILIGDQLIRNEQRISLDENICIAEARKKQLQKEKEKEELRVKNEELRVEREKLEIAEKERAKEKKRQRQIIIIVSIAAVVKIKEYDDLEVSLRQNYPESAKKYKIKFDAMEDFEIASNFTKTKAQQEKVSKYKKLCRQGAWIYILIN